MWPEGTHPTLFAESSCVCMPNFRPVNPLFFLAKVPFLSFLIEKVVWPHGNIDYIYGFVGLTSTIQA